MNLNVINLLLAKTLAEREQVGADRAFQLGLIAGMMPGVQGVILAALIARNEHPTATKVSSPPPATTPTTGPAAR